MQIVGMKLCHLPLLKYNENQGTVGRFTLIFISLEKQLWKTPLIQKLKSVFLNLALTLAFAFGNSWSLKMNQCWSTISCDIKKVPSSPSSSSVSFCRFTPQDSTTTCVLGGMTASSIRSGGRTAQPVASGSAFGLGWTWMVSNPL